MSVQQDSKLFQRIWHSYWDYYLQLEGELMATQRYVAFDSDNSGVFSLEYLKLYQAVCGEVDAVGKNMAALANPAFKATSRSNNIYKWWYEMQDAYRFYGPREDWSTRNAITTGVNLRDASVTPKFGMPLVPWKGFIAEKYKDKQNRVRYRAKGKTTPPWWSAHNVVKHQRVLLSGGEDVLNFKKANLGNVVSAFAGLYVLESSWLCAVGTDNDIDAFGDISVLFDGMRLMTSQDVDRICGL